GTIASRPPKARRIRPGSRSSPRRIRGAPASRDRADARRAPRSSRADPSVMRSRSAPHPTGDLDDVAYLGPLLIFREHVALLGRGEAALRRERELLERRELGGLADAALDVGCGLELARLRGDEAEDDRLLAGAQEPQRLEPARAVAVVLEEEAVVVGREEVLGDGLVAARRDPRRTEVAAADVRRDDEVVGLAREHAVQDVAVALAEPVGVDSALRAGALELRLAAEVAPRGVIELQVAAALGVERRDRVAVGVDEVVDVVV